MLRSTRSLKDLLFLLYQLYLIKEDTFDEARADVYLYLDSALDKMAEGRWK